MDSIESDDAVALFHEFLPGSASGVSVDEHIKGYDALLQGFHNVSGSVSDSASDIFEEHRTLAQENNEILPGSGSDPSSPSTVSDDGFPAYMAVASARESKNKRVWEVSEGKKKEATEKFVQRVKDRAENRKTYRGFLDLVSNFEEHRDVDQVNEEAIQLFQRQPELHIEFTNFLVDAVEAREKEENARPVSGDCPSKKKLKRSVVEKAEENRVVMYEEDVCTDLVLAPPVCRIGA